MSPKLLGDDPRVIAYARFEFWRGFVIACLLFSASDFLIWRFA